MADPLAEIIRRVLQDAPFAMRQLAADAGLSYDVLRSWRSGRRRPSRSSAARLAAGLEGRGQRLLLMARELRSAAEENAGEPADASRDDARRSDGAEQTLAAGAAPSADAEQHAREPTERSGGLVEEADRWPSRHREVDLQGHGRGEAFPD
jgi:transcriptional regulator with XRE-family HTH domain